MKNTTLIEGGKSYRFIENCLIVTDDSTLPEGNWKTDLLKDGAMVESDFDIALETESYFEADTSAETVTVCAKELLKTIDSLALNETKEEHRYQDKLTYRDRVLISLTPQAAIETDIDLGTKSFCITKKIAKAFKAFKTLKAKTIQVTVKERTVLFQADATTVITRRYEDIVYPIEQLAKTFTKTQTEFTVNRTDFEKQAKMILMLSKKAQTTSPSALLKIEPGIVAMAATNEQMRVIKEVEVEARTQGTAEVMFGEPILRTLPAFQGNITCNVSEKPCLVISDERTTAYFMLMRG
jgi:hypothetical protein